MIYNKYFRKLKFFTRGVVSSFLFKLLYRKGFDTSRAIMIFGSTRSGSTWLAELVSSVPGHSQIFEPLNTQYVKAAGKAGIIKNTYIKQDDVWNKGNKFFSGILSGRVMNPWLASQIPVKDVFSTRRLVIKFVRANLLLGWVCKNFDVLPPALVIRHPCAYVSSHMQKGWNPSLKVLLSNSYFDGLPEIREQCLNLTRPEELNALAWCLRYHAPLSLTKPYPFILVCYERLVRDGEKEIKRLFRIWDLEITKDIINRLGKPSDTVTNSSQIVTGKDPLAGWKRTLSIEQINNVLNVLYIFKMDFYSNELEADYEKLDRFPG